MAHTFRTITFVIVLVATTAAVIDTGFATADSSVSGGYRSSRTVDSRARTPQADSIPTVQAEPLTDAQQALVDWATDRFAQAGLELPEMVVRFDPTRELCKSAEGRYQHSPDSDKVVTICTRDSDSFAAELDKRRTLLHEFGHAWDYANLTAEDREELALILGAEAWNDSDHEWADRGVERFAETFVFALLDQPARHVKVSLECTAMVDAFRTATGAEPQGPGLPVCAA